MGRKKARFYKGIPSLKPQHYSKTYLDEKSLKKAASSSNAECIVPGEKIVDPLSNPIKEINTEVERLSRRKEKALEKYIEKKLKKEDRASLYERFQKSAVNTDQLQSTKYLSMAKRPDFESHSSESSDSDDDDDEPVYRSNTPKSSPLLYSAEVVEKNPFKANQELLMPSFMQDSSDSSSSSEDEAVFDHTRVSFMAPQEAAYFVPVERDASIQEQRSQLPIFGEEQAIMEAIRGNPVVIICGETGSGKTTQVPQFLYEAGFGDKASPNPGIIGVTQPRRVAAVSMAERVGVELNNPSVVGYQIRYDSSQVTSKTAIKFMTDGILLKEIQSDFLLNKYSVLLLDEAHERNLNTDILVGMLSRIVKLRWKKASEPNSGIRPLRLIIMSATLNVDEFAKPSLFNPLPPVLKVEARQHPVTVHFARKTNDDYLTEAFKTVSKIHANLPDGGILVFMSGKRDILSLCKKLREKYPAANQSFSTSETSISDAEADFASDFESGSEDESTFNDSDDSYASDASDASEEEGTGFVSGASTKQPLHVLPLYSLMSPEDQMRIFQDPPAGSRLCVIATNVAETSITIKNIRYVVDSGKVKHRIWDAEGRQRYEVVWASKASVAQRTGRAGRTGPGHCYRLYSAAVFENEFPKFSPPEIARMPIEGLVLQLKNMAIDHVERFPLPTEPEVSQVLRAQRNLVDLGMLDNKTFAITDFGRQAAEYPLTPSWAAMFAKAVNLAKNSANAAKYLPSVAAFVSVMSIGDPFEGVNDAHEETEESPVKKQNWKVFCGKPVVSDLFGALGAFFAYLKESPKARTAFCRQNGLVEKRLEEMRQQLAQLLTLISKKVPGFAFEMRQYQAMCSPEEKLFWRRLLAQAFAFQIAEKITLSLPPSDPNHKIATKFAAYRVLGCSMDSKEAVRFLHPSSHLSKIPPNFVVFSDALTVLDKKTNTPRHYIKNVTAIEPSWIPSSVLSKSI